MLTAAIAAVVLWFAHSPGFGLGVFLTALWAVTGFYALERLLREAAVPPGTPRNGFAIVIWGFVKLAVYGLAVWVLFSRPFPVMSHLVGFTILMVFLVILGASARARQINELRQSTGQGDDAEA